MTERQIGIGVGLYILNKNEQLLLGLRKSSHGCGTWCPPGGHLEYGESFEQAASRETLEETGLNVSVDASSSYYIYYSPYPGIAKKVLFFTAKSDTDLVKNQLEEVKNILWLSPEDALEKLTYKTDKDVLKWAIDKKAF